MTGPNPEAFRALSEADDSVPVVMLNLLKFRARAADGDRSGTQAYGDYGRQARTMIEDRGGRIVWQGRPEQVLIGGDSDDWDMLILVEYPSRKAFIEMVSSPSYREASGDRTSALERSALIACREV